MKNKFYIITEASLNDPPTGYRIGFGTFNDNGYVSFDVIWIKLEFLLPNPRNSAKFRIYYGDSGWNEWKNI